MYSFDLDKLLALFDEYCVQYAPDKSSDIGHLASEARKRIRQVDLLTKNVVSAERRITVTLIQGLQTKDMKPHEDAVFAMTTTVECCIYIAHRLTITLRSLPGLSDFSCPEISDVRNDLLAHPKEGMRGRSFSWGLPNGPAIKAVRTAQNQHHLRDSGLYYNVNCLFSKLIQKLNQVLEHSLV